MSRLSKYLFYCITTNNIALSDSLITLTVSLVMTNKKNMISNISQSLLDVEIQTKILISYKYEINKNFTRISKKLKLEKNLIAYRSKSNSSK